MNGQLLEFIKSVLTGLPNFAGLLIALYLFYAVTLALLARNQQLTDAMLACYSR